MPEFSIVIATHRRPSLLKRAISSCVNQSLNDHQIIVVSDAADPATYEVCSETLRAADIFVQHCGKRGPASSRNIGQQLAQGNNLVFLDDDDAFNPEFLEQVKQCRQLVPDDALLYTNFHVIDELDSSKSAVVFTDSADKNQLWVKNFIPNNCVIYPRKVFSRIAHDTDIAYEDWDFLLCAMELGTLVHAPITGPVVYKNVPAAGENRGESNMSQLLACYLNIYRKHPGAAPEILQSRRDFFSSIGLDLDALLDHG